MSNYEQLDSSLQDLRGSLLNHRLYEHLTTLQSLHVFMENHVFAVWDFMSLLKSLQRELTCVAIPWRPSQSASACRLINEIVLAEESDVDRGGCPASHFDLYVASMRQAGADTTPIDLFLKSLDADGSLDDALQQVSILKATRDFVATTFDIIASNDVCQIASAFTFGREDLLPGVFQCIVDEVDARSEGKLVEFVYYLQRHIELDGDEHGLMAKKLMEELCGDSRSRWEAAEQAAVRSLRARLEMWDAIADEIAVGNGQPVASDLR